MKAPIDLSAREDISDHQLDTASYRNLSRLVNWTRTHPDLFVRVARELRRRRDAFRRDPTRRRRDEFHPVPSKPGQR